MIFGEFFKNKRMQTGLSLRQFCDQKGLDSAYISRIENSIIPAPAKDILLKGLAKALGIEVNSPEWIEFFDLASLSKGQIPDDIQEEFPEVLNYLPSFLRSTKKEKVTKEDITKLLSLIKGGYEQSEPNQ